MSLPEEYIEDITQVLFLLDRVIIYWTEGHDKRKMLCPIACPRATRLPEGPQGLRANA